MLFNTNEAFVAIYYENGKYRRKVNVNEMIKIYDVGLHIPSRMS